MSARLLNDGARLAAGDMVAVRVSGHDAMMKLEDLAESLAAFTGTQAFAGPVTMAQTLGVTGFATMDGNEAATGPGVGITGGTGTICKWSIQSFGDVVRTDILIDLTGLNSGGTAGDIIGTNGAGAAYLGRIDYTRMGTPVAAQIACFETPAGGDTDFDVYSATEATGVEDVAISTLAETQLVNAGAHSAGTVDVFTALPADDEYLYLVGQGTSNATYTAGIFVITIWGKL